MEDDRSLGGIYAYKSGKPSYHNPPGVSGVDIESGTETTGMADAMGKAMYGTSEWESRKKRARRERRVKDALTWMLGLGCFVTSGLLALSAVIALVLLVRWLLDML